MENKRKWPPSNTGRTSEDYKKLEHEAAILYIKHGVMLKEIGRQLDVSFKTVSNWKIAGRWDDLRPDLEIMNQYKACAMFLQDDMTTGQIAMKLNISEKEVQIWADLFGWHVAKKTLDAKRTISDILIDFCNRLTEMFPDNSTAVSFVRSSFLKEMEPVTTPAEYQKIKKL